jgi:hypothetical protein
MEKGEAWRGQREKEFKFQLPCFPKVLYWASNSSSWCFGFQKNVNNSISCSHNRVEEGK